MPLGLVTAAKTSAVPRPGLPPLCYATGEADASTQRIVDDLRQHSLGVPDRRLAFGDRLQARFAVPVHGDPMPLPPQQPRIAQLRPMADIVPLVHDPLRSPPVVHPLRS